MPEHEHNPSPIDEEVKKIHDNPSQFNDEVDWPIEYDEQAVASAVRTAARNIVGQNWPMVFAASFDQWIFNPKSDNLSATLRQERSQKPGDIKLLMGHEEWRAWQYYVDHTEHFRVSHEPNSVWFGRSLYQGVELFHVDQPSLWLFV